MQNFRDMLANRKFAIPLIALLGMCLVGLLLLGLVLVLPGLRDDTRAEDIDLTPEQMAQQATQTAPPPSPTTQPTNTPRPTPTLVPVGTVVQSATGEPISEPVGAEETAAATVQPTVEAADAQPTPTLAVADEELADTGLGWGLILFSGAGLAGVAAAARRLRMMG